MTFDVNELEAIRERVATQRLTSQAAEDRAWLLEALDDMTDARDLFRRTLISVERDGAQF